MSSSSLCHRARPAFTLLEVILALAILAGSVAMLGEIIRSASRSAANAEAETRAQLLASTIMDEMVSGISEPSEMSREPLDVEDTVPWIYSVSFERTEISDLTSVEVMVEQDLEKKFRPVKYRLVRWLPRISISSPEEQKEDASESSSDSDTSSDAKEDDG